MEAGAIESLSATTIKVIYRVNGVWHMEKTGRVREKNTSRPPAAATRRDPPGAPGVGGGGGLIRACDGQWRVLGGCLEGDQRVDWKGDWRVIGRVIGGLIGELIGG